jgi:hypothetical protein
MPSPRKASAVRFSILLTTWTCLLSCVTVRVEVHQILTFRIRLQTQMLMAFVNVLTRDHSVLLSC